MRQRGFTLLELVAAMAIFAMMSVMAYGGLSALINTREGLNASYQRVQQWQMTVQRLRLDLGQVRARPIRDQFGDPQPALYEPEEGRLEFTHGGRRNPLLLPRSNLERVAYYLDTDGRLIRQSWAHLDRAQADTPLELTLLHDIDRLAWRFLDDQDEWLKDWPPNALSNTPNQAIPIPRAVELLLESKRLGELRFLFVTGVGA